MNFVIKCNSNDISSYIDSIQDIPVVSRNRNWEPIINNIEFILSNKCPYTIAVNDFVYCYFDSTIRYVGYVISKREIIEDKYEIIVSNYLNKLDKIMLDYNTMHELLNDTMTLHIGSPYYQITANGITDEITFYNGSVFAGVDRIQFICLDGALPAGILPNKYYYIRNVIDNVVQLSETPTGAITNIGSTGSGLTGTVYWGEVNLHKYVDLDSEGYPNLNLDWLLTRIFDKLIANNPYDNFAYDLSLINNINLFKKGSTYYKLQDLAIDENMLYALNQDGAGPHGLIDSDPERVVEKLTLLDFLKEFCKIFGFAIAFVGTDATNKIKVKFYPQIKNSDANPSPAYENLYSLTNNYIEDFDKIIMPAECDGYSMYTSFDIRYNYSPAIGIITTPIPKHDSYSSGVKATAFNVITNMRFLLRVDRTTGNVLDSTVEGNAVSTIFMILNHYYAKLGTWEKQEYTYSPDFTYLTVKEISYNVAQGVIEITQERYV